MNRLLISLATLTLVACQTAGTGSGNVRGTQKPVAFTWQSTDSVSGGHHRDVRQRARFQGHYFQITQDTLSITWSRSGMAGAAPSARWRLAPLETDPGPEFVQDYSGRVLANLHDDRGEYMRCRFTLISPSRGMAGAAKAVASSRRTTGDQRGVSAPVLTRVRYAAA